MGQKNTVASLEIELLMATASAVSDLVRFGGQVDRTTAESIKQLDRIDAAMKGIGDMTGPTAKMVGFAEETARTAVSAAREFNRIEKSGEALVRQLERQNASFGKTREELRQLAVEERAAAAARVGNADLAQRIRAQEAALYDKELELARRVRAEADAAAEEKLRAANVAVQAAEREAQARRAATVAYQAFEAAAQRGMATYREQQALAAAAARETEALATAAVRLKASIDPAFAAQQRFDQEMVEARRLISAGAISLDDYAAKLRQQRAALDDVHPVQGRVTASAAQQRAGMQQLGFQLNDIATMYASGANAGQIFGSQLGQITQALSMMTGGGNRFLTFLGSMQGTLVTVAAIALIPFIAKLFDESEAHKAAKEAADAHRKAVDDLARAQGQAILTAERKQAIDAATIKGDIDAALAIRARLAATLELQKANLSGALSRVLDPRGGGEDAGFVAAGAAATYERQVKATTALLDANAKLVNNLSREFSTGFARLVGMASDNASTPEGRIRAAAERRRMEAMQDPQNLGMGNAGRLRAQLDEITAARNRELEAIKESTRGRVRDAEVASPTSIAKMLRDALPGVHVTSTTRSVEHNRRVGGAEGSTHVRGNAIDFIPAGGMGSMTKADVRRIFEARGIGIQELLGPGDKGHNDHFHVAWLKGKHALDEYKDATQRATKAAREAAEVQRELDADLADVTRRFDPAQQAANDLTESLAKISKLQAAGRITPGDALGMSVEAVRQDTEARSKEWNDRMISTLGITGDPLEGILNNEQYKGEQRERAIDWAAKLNDSLALTADRWDLIANAAGRAGQGMADAFGGAGRALGDTVAIYAEYRAGQERGRVAHEAALEAAKTQAAKERENARYALATQGAQIGMYGDMASAAKGFFKEGSDGYKALAAAEKVFRAVEFAMSVRAIAQDAIETGSKIASSVARTAVKATEAVVNAIASLPFPLNLAAGAATVAALASLGVAIVGSFGGGGKNNLAKPNEGTGTVLGDSDAKSESLKRSIDALKEVDTLMLSTSRGMAASLRSIDNQIGGFAALVVRAGDVNASAGVDTGFKANVVGSVLGAIPVIGGLLKGLFGTSTKVIGGGLYGGAQSLGSILDGGFDASTYSDVEKKKKLFGITTSTKFRTEYGAADPTLENQFTLILRSFSEAITAAAGPLGMATGDIEGRLRGFVVDIGKIDLKGLTGAEIQEKLSAVFGAAADDMATAAFPGFERFQKVGEGMFETLVRISSTVEAVTSSLDLLGTSTRTLGIDAKIGLADQFDSVGDLTSAVEGYFQTFYTEAEQAAAKTAQFGKVFESLGLSMPGTLAGFRELVEAQDLTSAAGQATYATLLQLAPAFADLKTAMDGAKSAADVMSERRDLERRLLELNGDTAAIRALDLAKLDASNRGLQQQIYAVQDAQEAARAADELRKAWASVGDGIMDEVKRIRGLSGAEQGGGFAVLMGQFNAANAAARGGDQDAAKSLPGISQALLNAAALVATSRQELDRVQAQTAASLEATYGAISGLSGTASTSALEALAAAGATQAANSPAAAGDRMEGALRELRDENAAMRRDLTAALATIASNTGRIDRRLEDVTTASGGDAISVAA